MRNITRNQYIAIVVTVVIVIGFFFGGTVWTSVFGTNQSANNQTTQMTDLQSDVSVGGSGVEAAAGDTITVNYTGKLQDGTVFDSSYNRGVPFSFVLGVGQVIPGWDQGLIGAKKGEKLTLTIPGNLAYGASGIPNGNGGYVIPPNATLIFDIEVVDIQQASGAATSTAQ